MFAGIIGAFIFACSFWAWVYYTPTSHGVQCGSLHDGGRSHEAHQSDLMARLGGGYQGHTDDCEDTVDALILPVYGGMAVGVATVAGAVLVRTRKTTKV